MQWDRSDPHTNTSREREDFAAHARHVAKEMLFALLCFASRTPRVQREILSSLAFANTTYCLLFNSPTLGATLSCTQLLRGIYHKWGWNGLVKHLVDLQTGGFIPATKANCWGNILIWERKSSRFTFLQHFAKAEWIHCTFCVFSTWCILRQLLWVYNYVGEIWTFIII